MEIAPPSSISRSNELLTSAFMPVVARRSFPILAKSQSETSSAALVALILIPALLLLALFAGLFCIARPHTHQQDEDPRSNEKTETDVELGTPATLDSGTIRSSLRSPPFLNAESQETTSLLIPVGEEAPQHHGSDSGLGNHLMLKPASPPNNLSSHGLDLDVVTLSQQSVDNTARQSLVTDVRTSMSSTLETYLGIQDDSSVYSDCSVGTARPQQNMKGTQSIPEPFQISGMLQSPYIQDDGSASGNGQAARLPMQEARFSDKVLNFSRPISRQIGYSESSACGPSGVIQSDGDTFRSAEYHTYQQVPVGDYNQLPASPGEDKGKAPMRNNSIGVPPLVIRKLPSPENVHMGHVSPAPFNTSTRFQRVGGYGGFLQDRPTAQDLSKYKSPHEVGGEAGPSHVPGHNPGTFNAAWGRPRRQNPLQDHDQQVLYAKQRSSPISSTLPYLEARMSVTGSDVSSDTIRFPLHKNSVLSGRSGVSPELYDPWPSATQPNPDMELRHLENRSRPEIHTELQTNTESVHLGLAPPRESTAFEWEEKQRLAQGQEGATLPSDSSGLLAESLSNSTSTNEGERLSRKKKRYRLHRLVKKMLY